MGGGLIREGVLYAGFYGSRGFATWRKCLLVLDGLAGGGVSSKH